jgi:hypothetical protein
MPALDLQERTSNFLPPGWHAPLALQPHEGVPLAIEEMNSIGDID